MANWNTKSEEDPKSNNPEKADDIHKEITEDKDYSEVKWEDLAPQVQYAIKAEKAKQCFMNLLCQRYTKDQIEQSMADWNYEFPPTLEPDYMQQTVDDLWRRYDGLYPPPESKMNSVLFKSEVINWGEFAWNKLLNYLEDWGSMYSGLSKAMEKHMSAVDDGERLRDFLGGYFLIANHEAPGYIIDAMFESINEIVNLPPNINKDRYDSEGYTLYQAITIDGFAKALCEDPLLLIEIFEAQDTKFIRDICSTLTILIGLMEVKDDG